MGSVRLKFNLKAIQSIQLNDFSGESEKYTDWYDSTALRFGRAAAKPLLEDEALCDDNIDISHAAKCIVAGSLENGSASHLNTIHKHEKNLATFMNIIAAKYDNKVDARNREFTQWKNLFLLQMDKPEECEDFINNFEIAVSKLREHKSKAVEDEALMSALILHAIRAREYHYQKIKITNDLNIKPDDIIKDIRQHFTAIRTDENITGTSASSKKVRFAGKVRKNKSGEADPILKEKTGQHFHVPPFPKDLAEVVSDKVFERLN